jgi:nucleoside-diphosphate-sugar epimerase
MIDVAVTGASGNVGTAVVDALAQRSDVGRIVGVVRRPPAWRADRVRWQALDIAEDGLADAFRGCDVVMHLAWRIQPGRDRDALWRTNVLGTARVLDAVATAGVPRLVHASSVGAYSPAPADGIVDESWPTHGIPQLDYSWQKAYVERMLDAFAATQATRVARIRPALVFRHDVAHEIRRLFLGRWIPTRLLGPGLERWLDGIAPRFQVVHSLDVADAFVLAAFSDATGAFNVAAEPLIGASRVPDWAVPVAHDIGALASALHLVAAVPGWIDLGLRAPIMSTVRARDTLGWTPRYSAGATLSELLRGFHADADFPTPPLHRTGLETAASA